MVAVANTSTSIDEGKMIFTARCASCHNVNKVIVGPALAGVDQRRSINWIINFVHSSQTMIKNGDKQAVALFEAHNKIAMPDHADLSDDNIKSVVDFIKSSAVTGNASTPAAAESSSRFGKVQPNYVPLSIANNYQFFACYLTAVGMLVLTLLFAVHVKSLENNMREIK
jgi:cytochrome c551/c552